LLVEVEGEEDVEEEEEEEVDDDDDDDDEEVLLASGESLCTRILPEVTGSVLLSELEYAESPSS